MKCLFIVLAVVLNLSAGSFAQGPCSWSPLGSGVVFGCSPLAVFDDGSGPALYAGSMATAGGSPVNWIARWNGNIWSPLGSGLSNPPLTLAAFDDGSGRALYAGGLFFSAGGIPVASLAKWDGTSWSALGASLGGGVVLLRALQVFDDGTGSGLYVAGSFSSAGGLPALGIARWDGLQWTPLGSGLVGVTSAAMAVYDDGSGPALYVGGGFSSAGGQTTNHIARWDGSSWSPLGAGLGCPSPAPIVEVYTMAVFDDGTGPALYVGGQFTTAGGVPALNIARWDGVSWSAVAGGFPVVVSGLAAFDDGTGPNLYATHGFSTGGLERWDGNAWSVVGGGVVQVAGPISVFDDGTGPGLYVCGANFLPVGGVALNGIARWSCASTISVSSTQPGGSGSPVFLSNTNLTLGREYYNIFSFDLCPGGPGTGPFGGLCVSTAANFQFVVDQLMAPLGASPIHFTAPSSYLTAGPFTLPPLTMEAITFDFTGGVLGPISQVATITVQ